MDPEIPSVPMHEPQPSSSYPQRARRMRVSFALILLLVLINALVGLFGGVAGFVLLTNSKSTAVEHLRERLGLNDKDSQVVIPVRQNVTLEESSSVIDAAAKVSPAVVSISANQQVQDFFGRTSTQEVSGGTGFIYTSDGLIVTNKHVVSQSGVQYKVVLADGRIFDATVQSLDPYNDLAIVKIDGKDLPTVDTGSSDSLKVGQYVLAVGNALGEFSNSVSLGIVSAKGRTISAGEQGNTGGSEDLTGLIQTDASVNPGNSGGPLVNMAGQVVGINTAIASPTGSSVGIGFSIPIDSVKTVIDNAIKNGNKIIRPYLGVTYVPVNKSVQQVNNLPVDYGAWLSAGQGATTGAIIANSPASKAGLQDNDIILEVNGDRVDQDNTLQDRLGHYAPGATVTLKIMRSGKEQEVKVTLDKNPSS